jgi:hypothetical protein
LVYFSTLKMETICFSETSRSLRTTRRYNPEHRTLHFIILFSRPEIDRRIHSDLNPGGGTLSERSLRAALHALVYLPLLSVIYLLLSVWRGDLRGSPCRLRDHLCGHLPIPSIQPQRFGNGEWLLNAVASFKNSLRMSQKTSMYVAVRSRTLAV